MTIKAAEITAAVLTIAAMSTSHSLPSSSSLSLGFFPVLVWDRPRHSFLGSGLTPPS